MSNASFHLPSLPLYPVYIQIITTGIGRKLRDLLCFLSDIGGQCRKTCTQLSAIVFMFLAIWL